MREEEGRRRMHGHDRPSGRMWFSMVLSAWLMAISRNVWFPVSFSETKKIWQGTGHEDDLDSSYK